MFSRTNKQNQTAFVGNETAAGLGLFYSVPFRGVKKAQKLTLRQGQNRVDLSGSQVNALLRVVRNGRRLANA
jgi:hypothetical protein